MTTAMNLEYNRILGTSGLVYYEQDNKYFDDYEITEMPVQK